MYIFLVYFACCVTRAFSALDVVILVDTSHRIGKVDWRLEGTVIINSLYATGNIDTTDVRILGLVRYHNNTIVQRPLVSVKESNFQDVKNAIYGMSYVTTETGANLAAGLLAAAQLFEACYNRKNVPNLCIVVTSYSDSSIDDIREAATVLKEISSVMTFAMDPREDKTDGHISPAEVDVIATNKSFQQHYSEFDETLYMMQSIKLNRTDNSATNCKDCPSFYENKVYRHTYEESVPADIETDKTVLNEYTYVMTPSGSFKDSYIYIETNNVTQMKVTIFRKDGSKKSWNMAYLPTFSGIGKNNSSINNNKDKWRKFELKTRSSKYHTVDKIAITFKGVDNQAGISYRNLIISGCQRKT